MHVARHQYEVDSWGVGELWVAGDAVVAHELPRPGGARDGGGSPRHTPKGTPGSPENTLAEEGGRDGADFVSDVIARVRAQLAGRQTSYVDVLLDLGWCTSFQADVAGALRAVPWGEIVSYGELAALAGYPGAARAVGTFCAQNRFPLLVPCHRVVGASGIGGYGESGVELKRRLLALEGVIL